MTRIRQQPADRNRQQTAGYRTTQTSTTASRRHGYQPLSHLACFLQPQRCLTLPKYMLENSKLVNFITKI